MMKYRDGQDRFVIALIAVALLCTFALHQIMQLRVKSLEARVSKIEASANE